MMDVAAHQGTSTCGNIVIKKPHQGKENEVRVLRGRRKGACGGREDDFDTGWIGRHFL